MVATPDGVDEVSSALRNARERSGLGVEEISARTKIKPAFLRALETGHFEVLPGHFFARAFLKTYAREVGLSADEVVADFDRAHGRPAAIEPAAIATTLAAHPREKPLRLAPPERQPLGGVWQVVAAAGLMLLLLTLTDRPEPTGATGPVAVGTGGSVKAATPPADTALEATTPEKLTIRIDPADTIWVAATADGTPAIYKLLQPGQQVTVTGHNVFFRIGNAAAFVYSVNGAPGKPIGRANEVREFSIRTDNYRAFLR